MSPTVPIFKSSFLGVLPSATQKSRWSEAELRLCSSLSPLLFVLLSMCDMLLFFYDIFSAGKLTGYWNTTLHLPSIPMMAHTLTHTCRRHPKHHYTHSHSSHQVHSPHTHLRHSGITYTHPYSPGTLITSHTLIYTHCIIYTHPHSQNTPISSHTQTHTRHI